MTKEEKQLLLIDLCARLPYGVMVENILSHKIYDLSKYLYCLPTALVENFRPYLRPMSSMTEEENKEVKEYLSSIEGQLIGFSQRVIWVNDYCLSHHIDNRHLIEKGIALEAPEGMYKTK